MVWLTIATGECDQPSASVKSRPRVFVIPSVALKCGVTPMKEMPASSPVRAGRPSTITVPPPPPLAERHEIRRERRPDAGQRFHAPDDVFDAPELGILGLVGVPGQEEAHRHERLRIEAEIAPAEVHERAHEQERADERHEREGHLQHHQ